jgi:hypothetical protein
MDGRATRLYFIVMLVLSFSSAAVPAGAQGLGDAVLSSISSYVNDVDRIARVKVVKRTPVSFDGLVTSENSLAAKNICGYYYHAEVIEDFKGGKKPVNFFSSTEADFQGLDRDYLVFLYRRDADEAKKYALILEDRVLSANELVNVKLSCRVFGEFYTGTREQTMFAFDPEATSRFGGDWLLLSNRDAMEFCGGEPTGDYVARRKDPDDPSSAVVQWEGVRLMIQTAMKNRYKFWLSYMDRMHGC